MPPLRLYDAHAKRQAMLVAVVVALVAVPLIILLLYWLRKPPGATDCVPATSWSAWSECSVPCAPAGTGASGGTGWEFRTRPPAVLPTNGGAECRLEDLVQSRTCAGDVPCGAPCVPNADPDQFAWSGCPACLPAGAPDAMEWRIVPPQQEPGPYGAPCPPGSVFQTRACPGMPPCPANRDCSISSRIVASTPCSARCGSGVQVLWHDIAAPPSGSGAGCDWGLLVQEVPCEAPAGPCPAQHACDPDAATGWSPWSPCDATCGTGWQVSTREPTGPLDLCPLLRSRSCDGLLPACTDPARSVAGCCIAGAGPDGAGGCVSPTWDYLNALCYMRCAGMPLPSDAQTDDGRPFCSVTEALLDAACGGAPGAGCELPRDCALGSWSAWSACSVGGCAAEWPQGGVQVSSRAVLAYESGGGRPCADFPTVLHRPCANMDAVPYWALTPAGDGVVPATMAAQCVPVDCSLSDWAPVGPCSAACGPGWQTWVRSVTTPASGGGTCDANPGDYFTSRSCTGPYGACAGCTFVDEATYLADCAATGTDPWSACSAPCDGVQTLMLPIAQAAPPGGWCSVSDAVRTQPCCIGCACNAGCPVGVNGVPCSGNGACTSVSSTGPGSVGGWAFTCACFGAYSGAACGLQCPVNPDGSACGAASGLGVCGADGLCTCTRGVSGPACSVGGECVVNMSLTADPAGANPWLFQVAVPLIATTVADAATAINQSSCAAFANAWAGATARAVTAGNGSAGYQGVAYAGYALAPAHEPPDVQHVRPFDGASAASVNALLVQLYGPGGAMPDEFAAVPQLSTLQTNLTQLYENAPPGVETRV